MKGHGLDLLDQANQWCKGRKESWELVVVPGLGALKEKTDGVGEHVIQVAIAHGVPDVVRSFFQLVGKAIQPTLR